MQADLIMQPIKTQHNVETRYIQRRFSGAQPERVDCTNSVPKCMTCSTCSNLQEWRNYRILCACPHMLPSTHTTMLPIAMHRHECITFLASMPLGPASCFMSETHAMPVQFFKTMLSEPASCSGPTIAGSLTPLPPPQRRLTHRCRNDAATGQSSPPRPMQPFDHQRGT